MIETTGILLKSYLVSRICNFLPLCSLIKLIPRFWSYISIAVGNSMMDCGMPYFFSIYSTDLVVLSIYLLINFVLKCSILLFHTINRFYYQSWITGTEKYVNNVLVHLFCFIIHIKCAHFNPSRKVSQEFLPTRLGPCLSYVGSLTLSPRYYLWKSVELVK